MPDLGHELRDLVDGALRPVDVDAIVGARRRRRTVRRLSAMAAVAVVATAGAVVGVAASRHDDRTLIETRPSSSVPAAATTSTTVTSPTTAPTTTEPPVSHGAAGPPVSATWVSAQHGWVLHRGACTTSGRCRYDVSETVDGGTTWRVAGSLPSGLDESARLRFADGSHGYAYDRASLFATTDGGAHWSRVTTPFDGVQALETARSTVYVVGFTSRAPDGFRIWTTPVGTERWHAEPLTIPLGAGPVPQQQLVFAPGAAWVLNQDRGVMAGARRRGNGAWEAWRPSCRGSASMAAPTADDVVVLCTEGEFTGPTVTQWLDVSHDGGDTFTRHRAFGGVPVGGVVSPSPDVAVIVASKRLWRTTDDGGKWSVVLDLHRDDAMVDGGFTNASQGFVVLQSSGMFMTHDGGASWEHVRFR